MTQFLVAQPTSDSTFAIALVSDPVAALQRNGQASPIFGLRGGEVAIPDDCSITMFFAPDPRQLIVAIEAAAGVDSLANVFVTHGLANVGVISTEEDARSHLLAELAKRLAQIPPYEVWTLVAKRLSVDQIEFAPSPYVAEALPSPESQGARSSLGFLAATQLAEIEAQLAQLIPVSNRYCPELADLGREMSSAANTAAEDIERLTPETKLAAVQEMNQHRSGLVEISAGLSMVASQAGSGRMPILREEYSIGQYSLFGIGTAWRGVWSLYRFLVDEFAEFGVGDRLRQIFERSGGFNPFTDGNTISYSEWKTSTCRLVSATVTRPDDPRLHALYFSSRQGFHESQFTMSVAWSTLAFGASRESNLMTLSHELIHAHVREIMTAVFDGIELARVHHEWQNAEPSSPRLAFQIAVLHGVRLAGLANDAASEILRTGEDSLRIDGWSDRPSVVEIATLVEGTRRRYAHEIFVHVLDYLYVYGGNDDSYVSAIWSSWADVPQVSLRLRHYLVRTLCALSSLEDDPIANPNAFGQVSLRLDNALESLANQAGDPVVLAALTMLRDDIPRRAIQIEFEQAYYLVRLCRVFFYASQSELASLAESEVEDFDADEFGSVLNSFEVGSYGTGVDNPSAFLLDQFRSYPAVAGPSCEFASLWQFLLLASTRVKGGVLADELF